MQVEICCFFGRFRLWTSESWVQNEAKLVQVSRHVRSETQKSTWPPPTSIIHRKGSIEFFVNILPNVNHVCRAAKAVDVRCIQWRLIEKCSTLFFSIKKFMKIIMKILQCEPSKGSFGVPQTAALNKFVPSDKPDMSGKRARPGSQRNDN